MSSKNSECVRVVIRCRPFNERERDESRSRIVEMNVAQGQVLVTNPKADADEPSKPFTFDQVYDWTCTQDAIYNETAFPIVESVLQGYNGTIFAYGQTGTGKTHTMEGKDSPPELKGVIPRAFDHIFDAIQTTTNKQFLVRASFLEIYNEEIRDLLAKNPKNKLELKENPESGVYVKDLSSFVVKSVEEMKQVMLAGRKNRSVGGTLMNQDSSRSHSIFTVTVETSETGPDGENHIRVGKLNMVDLAGSERQSKTGATGDRLKEATKINLSLSSLGHVISALVDSKSSHIPYRDSKLTRLLQDSLGGNTKTVMVANIGPADYNYDETLSTLRYAQRAKSIKNKPTINEDPKDAMLREFQEEIARLKAELAYKGNGAMGTSSGGVMMMPGETVVKEVVKIVEVERPMDKQQLEAMEERLRMEKEEIQRHAEEERRKIEEAKNMAEEEKNRLLEELRQQEEEQEKARMAQQNMVVKLKSMEEKLLVGSQVMEKAMQQEKELMRAKMELEDRRRQEKTLARELQEKAEQALELNVKFTSQQQELQVRTEKLEQLWNKYQTCRGEIRDLQSEFQREREDMLDMIRELTRQIKLKNSVIENFIPPEEVSKIESRAEWSDENDEWIIPRIQYAGNSVRPKRPPSAVGLKRPTTEYSRIARAMGDMNPRYRHDNIINMDLDMPDRSTEDYAQTGGKSQRVHSALQAALNDEEDMTFIQSDSMPNVYFTYTEDGAVREDTAAAPNKKPTRAKSAKLRPGTASRKGRSRRPVDEAGVDVPAYVESMAHEMETEQYPKARGLVRG
eukprot:GILJ01004530.1.p1 GENE.GILJ01004530.1~~GILJ01004530.1.p1  ORF type:complete len:795 (-),score=178.48 GILJ01004530.1:126-2510(-)